MSRSWGTSLEACESLMRISTLGDFHWKFSGRARCKSWRSKKPSPKSVDCDKSTWDEVDWVDLECEKKKVDGCDAMVKTLKFFESSIWWSMQDSVRKPANSLHLKYSNLLWMERDWEKWHFAGEKMPRNLKKAKAQVHLPLQTCLVKLQATWI